MMRLIKNMILGQRLQYLIPIVLVYRTASSMVNMEHGSNQPTLVLSASN